MVGGLSYWFNPYDELSLLGISIYKLMGAGAFLGSLSLTLILNKRPWEIALLITTGIMISIMCRIILMVLMIQVHTIFSFRNNSSSFISVPSAFIGLFVSIA
jgi:hypothetical protein